MAGLNRPATLMSADVVKESLTPREAEIAPVGDQCSYQILSDPSGPVVSIRLRVSESRASCAHFSITRLSGAESAASIG